jgi:hypothetical protein
LNNRTPRPPSIAAMSLAESYRNADLKKVSIQQCSSTRKCLAGPIGNAPRREAFILTQKGCPE